MGTGGLDVFGMETQIEESPECLIWECREEYLAKKKKNIECFRQGIKQLADYYPTVPYEAFRSAVNEAFENISGEMRESARWFGIYNAEELECFIMGYRFSQNENLQ